MTREEKAMRAIAPYLDLDGDTLNDAITAMIAFADAEAAAMRERAAGVATAHADRARGLMSAGGDAVTDTRVTFELTADAIAFAIRALPATGEVGRA